MNTPRHKSGQMTVIGLLMIFLTLMVLANLMDTITATSNNMSTNLTSANFPEEAVLVRLIPLFIIVTILASIAMYGAPQT